MCDEIPNTIVQMFLGTIRYEREIKRNYDVEIKNHSIKLTVICDNMIEYDYVCHIWLHWPPLYCTRIFTVSGCNLRQ
jgi:hypothetical protein